MAGTPLAGTPGSVNGTPAKSSSGYHFICECFFLTAKGVHLGLIKVLEEIPHLSRTHGRFKDELEALQAEEDRRVCVCVWVGVGGGHLALSLNSLHHQQANQFGARGSPEGAGGRTGGGRSLCLK